VNPYALLFSHPVDIAIAWAAVAAWLVVVATLLRGRFTDLPIRSDQVCSQAASAFLALAVLIMAVFTIGLVFLAWLKITSAFWFIWQLFYLMSVVCVFRVLPFFAVALLCWAVIGRWRAGFSLRTLRLTSAYLLAVLLDAALYFFMSYVFDTNAA